MQSERLIWRLISCSIALDEASTADRVPPVLKSEHSSVRIDLHKGCPGVEKDCNRNTEIHLTDSQYSLAGCEPHTVLMAKSDTLREA